MNRNRSVNPENNERGTSFSEGLEASIALVNLRLKLGLPPNAKVKEIAEAALARIEELEFQRDLTQCRLEEACGRLDHALAQR